MRKPIVRVIDDDAAVRESLQLLLEGEGIEVHSYASGEAFLREAAPSDDSCLIIDVELQGIDGIELLDRLRASGINTPAIIITGRKVAGTLILTIKRFDAMLALKPFLPGELLSYVKLCLGRF